MLLQPGDSWFNRQDFVCQVWVSFPSKKCCIQDLIPSIGKASETPVAAVHARMISTVSRRMCISSELRKQGYVEQVDWFGHGAEDARHYSLSWNRTTWVSRSAYWLRLSVTVLCVRIPPFCSPVARTKQEDSEIRFMKQKPQDSQIDVGIHPFGPRSQPLVEGHQPIHVLVNLVSISHIVPSAPQNCFLSYRVRGEGRQEELWGICEQGRSHTVGFSFVCPPVPCVEDQHVDAQPGRTGLDGVEPQHAADAFLHDVHQVGALVPYHRHAIVLQYCIWLADRAFMCSVG
ncbi:hypothetical protein MUK42_36617 [Musa troglodytarum]|uniref:Uncharacterized protein n=1 Tax=Musa troglodytarum TaxID=320322 RepID=A0A9E7KFP1_9LILI|nr:hypothetical protein MUK42_36617 [Musa troglodytarum]